MDLQQKEKAKSRVLPVMAVVQLKKGKIKPELDF